MLRNFFWNLALWRLQIRGKSLTILWISWTYGGFNRRLRYRKIIIKIIILRLSVHSLILKLNKVQLTEISNFNINSSIDFVCVYF